MLTVNAAWNIWNFRQPVLKALLSDSHRVTVLAPADDSVAKLEEELCPKVGDGVIRRLLEDA
ncbi:hypothetical protein RM543_17875 [Roseicyclus sp. F158]|uniref:Uncharacterized protein n=1 Tax=Tropicimonas omnivorans TaxID=3075590 RepID=A0ABU3DLF0_9RHOB|nr:hypothetical protein [Roseicyclus sp. F158]MDT0684544.1 hypothetical protein [Roseicyclus sp. F158]